MTYRKYVSSACALVCLNMLVACGGGSSTNAVAPEAPVAPTPVPAPGSGPTAVPPVPEAMSPPGGLYVGYYAEDPVNNPEDPTYGAFQLRLPEGNAEFSGSMYFTYVGCQTSNVGSISGVKSGLDIGGSITGDVDGLAQNGTYAGLYDPAALRYSGTYALEGGRQYRDLRPCIEYYIAANGTFEMFPPGASVPADFGVTVNGRTIQWSSVAGAQQTLVYVLNAADTGASNPVLWQQLVSGTTATALPPSVALVAGTEYLAAVAVASGTQQRLAFSSVLFTAP